MHIIVKNNNLTHSPDNYRDYVLKVIASNEFNLLLLLDYSTFYKVRIWG